MRIKRKPLEPDRRTEVCARLARHRPRTEGGRMQKVRKVVEEAYARVEWSGDWVIKTLDRYVCGNWTERTKMRPRRGMDKDRR